MMTKSFSYIVAAALAVLGSVSAMPVEVQRRAPAGVPGFDISHYQGAVNMNSAKANGAQFVIIKATEGQTVVDNEFSTNYNAATNADLIRGGYHFARPATSSGSSQANFFLAHGGGWSGDGLTLPGMLDLENNPSGSQCYGLSTSAMITWVTDFVNTYYSSTGRYPMIYTTYNFWVTCVGNTNAFSNKSPLVLARYASSVGSIPGGWPYQTIWQYADSGTFPGDQDAFNGSPAGLKKLATG